jgi:hypothetical protein
MLRVPCHAHQTWHNVLLGLLLVMMVVVLLVVMVAVRQNGAAVRLL